MIKLALYYVKCQLHINIFNCQCKYILIHFPIVRNIRIIFLLFLLFAVIVVSIFLFVGYLSPKGAGIYIDSSPSSEIYIDDVKVGRTPYKYTRKPGEVLIKLIPDSFGDPLVPYSVKVNLVSGVETIVRKTFSSDPSLESSEILSFEKSGNSSSGFSIVTDPDSAKVVIDSSITAFTPYKNSSLFAGNHTVEISLLGYITKKFDVKIYDKYKMIAIVKLAKDNTITPTPTPTPVSEVSQSTKEVILTVKILSTPTGFLRVRNEPSTLGTEIGQAEPDEEYPLVSEDVKTGWYQIEFEKGKKGWITNQYAQKFEDGKPVSNIKLSPTPTKTSGL